MIPAWGVIQQLSQLVGAPATRVCITWMRKLITHWLVGRHAPLRATPVPRPMPQRPDDGRSTSYSQHGRPPHHNTEVTDVRLLQHHTPQAVSELKAGVGFVVWRVLGARPDGGTACMVVIQTKPRWITADSTA